MTYSLKQFRILKKKRPIAQNMRSRKSDICLSSTLFKMKIQGRALSLRHVIGQCGEYALRIQVPQLKDTLDFEIKRDLASKLGIVTLVQDS